MKISAIISEFDPFHNGHKYLVEHLREIGYTHIISIMSGNFTQRGFPAIVPKHARVKSSLSCGIDLVIEIPSVWCQSPAEKYALAGVTIANSLGIVDTLSFGSECGNIKTLKDVYSTISTDSFKLKLKYYISNGNTLAKSYGMALKESDNQINSSIFDQPNNILGVQYIKAIKELNSKISPYTIKRLGVNHGSRSFYKDISSASYIRELIIKKEPFKDYIPEEMYRNISDEITNGHAPVNIYAAERAILYQLRQISRQALSNIADISEGLENRIFHSAQKSCSLNELYFNIKTKRYTMSRIRRIIICALLGITKEISNYKIPYIRILGANQRGFEILKQAKLKSSLPIITRSSDMHKLTPTGIEVFNLECRATDTYGLMCPKCIPCGTEKTQKMVIV